MRILKTESANLWHFALGLSHASSMSVNNRLASGSLLIFTIMLVFSAACNIHTEAVKKAKRDLSLLQLYFKPATFVTSDMQMTRNVS